MKRIKVILLLASFLFSPLLWAQEPQQSYTVAGRNFKRGVAAVMFSTIGGAVLGLSTLSFYGKPQEHTGNITTGALIGLAAGIGYVAYDSNRPPVKSGNYDFSWEEPDQKLRRTSLFAVNKSVPLFQYQFEF